MDNDIYSAAPFSSAVSVSELNEFIKLLIDSAPTLNDIYVKGEISNFKNHSSGHFYFSLKDKDSRIAAVMFRGSASKLAFVPENGMMVVAHGRISSYVRDGQYQLYADSMEPDGVGSLYIAFEQIKRRLEAEGIFAPEGKKHIPKIPRRIGVITSPTGAAVRDIINIATRRFPFAKIIVYPALVQGENAEQSLISGVKYFNRTRSADVLIIGRGGGSIEDLWAFNSEELARTVSASEIPVISAVGHETDFTICDFAADLRAPTPSAAAELAVPDTAELKVRFNNIVKRIEPYVENKIKNYRSRVEVLAKSRYLNSPEHMLEDKRADLIVLSDRLVSCTERDAQSRRMALGAVAGKLEALSPLAVLGRGYGAVYSQEGKVLKSISDISVGDSISVKMSDGEISASVNDIQGGKDNAR